jgi:hypothetical protein
MYFFYCDAATLVEEMGLWTWKDFFFACESSGIEIWSHWTACTISDDEHDLDFFLALHHLCHGSLRDVCQETGIGVVDVVKGILNLSDADAEVSATSETNT